MELEVGDEAQDIWSRVQDRGGEAEPQRIVGDLLTAETSEKQARSIRYQISIAKLPLAKDIDDFAFDDALVNETLVRDLASGDFMEHQRNVVLVGGTGTGKTHLAIAIARSCRVIEAASIREPVVSASRSTVDISDFPLADRL